MFLYLVSFTEHNIHIGDIYVVANGVAQIENAEEFLKFRIEKVELLASVNSFRADKRLVVLGGNDK